MIIFLPAYLSLKNAIFLETTDEDNSFSRFSTSIPIGKISTEVTLPLYSTPLGVDSKPKILVQLLTKCLSRNKFGNQLNYYLKYP